MNVRPPLRAIAALVMMTTAFGVMAGSRDAQATFPGTAGRIAFIRDGNVWTMRADGRRQAQLTSSGTAADPTWSPDGHRIAYAEYSADTGDGWDIWVMRRNGSHKTRLTHRRYNEVAPAWSPSGRRLAFSVRGTSGDMARVVKVRLGPPSAARSG